MADALLKGEKPEADEEALSGAIDILAHTFATDSDARMTMLRAMEKEGEVEITPSAGRSDLPPRYASLKGLKGKLSRLSPPKLLALLRALCTSHSSSRTRRSATSCNSDSPCPARPRRCRRSTSAR